MWKSLAVLVCLAACTKQADLKEYVYEDAGFAIKFARDPSEMKGTAGFTGLMTIFPEASYRVDYSDPKTPMPAKVLDALEQQFPTGHHVAVTGADAAYEYDSVSQGMHVRLRAVAANGHLYNLLVAAKEIDEDSTAAFFATFRILPKK